MTIVRMTTDQTSTERLARIELTSSWSASSECSVRTTRSMRKIFASRTMRRIIGLMSRIMRPPLSESQRKMMSVSNQFQAEKTKFRFWPRRCRTSSSVKRAPKRFSVMENIRGALGHASPSAIMNEFRMMSTVKKRFT